MDIIKSLDEVDLITALLRDIQKMHEAVLNVRALRLTTEKVASRTRKEGKSFLTKTLPRLGKAFDRVLASDNLALNATELGFETYPGAAFPKLFGELFEQVLDSDGKVLPEPCVQCVRSIRQLSYVFYKYELPYTHEQEQQVLDSFKKTEEDLRPITADLRNLRDLRVSIPSGGRRKTPTSRLELAREARRLLYGVFSFFDERNIVPGHGPGAVATKQRLWTKYQWSNVSSRITDEYPLDAYYYASLGHVADRLQELTALGDRDLPARVILVPKDSRGPRLISCEPVDFQWIQQGLGRAIVEHVESTVLTKHSVFFTDQCPNRIAALFGSQNGLYSTLDLKDASDRISIELVKLLWPEHLVKVLMACRSCSTVLPDGQVIELLKYAPMGSALCFPVLALTVWAILVAGLPHMSASDRQVAIEGIHVYGDDVIVPTAHAANAIEQLESFGLLINRDKSCTSGFFRESCGLDAFKGVDVTPVRFRTVWSSIPTASSYCSWIAYANSMYDKKYFTVYDLIVERLGSVYGPIPHKTMQLHCPSLSEATELTARIRRRTHTGLQKVQYKVRIPYTRPIEKAIDGWSMLLRYFTEARRPPSESFSRSLDYADEEISSFSASMYTPRDASKLVFRWQ
jgi:hypothetical protein